MELQKIEQLSLFSSQIENISVTPLDKPVCKSLEKEKKVPLTIKETFSEYEHHLRSIGKSENTIESFLIDIKQLSSAFPKHKLEDYSLTDLKEFLSTCRSKGQQPKTVNRKCTAIKNYFKFLKEMDYIKDNPANAIICPRVSPPLPTILTDTEVSAFYAAAKSSIEKILAFFLLGSGLKRSELLSLEKNNINISNPSNPCVDIKGNNRYKSRIVRLPLEFTQIYKEYLLKIKERDLLLNISPDHINVIVRQIAKRAGIKKKVSCQILRDTFAVRCLKAGDTIQEMLSKLGLAPDIENREIAEKYSLLLEKQTSVC